MEPCPNKIENSMDFMVIMGNCIGFNRNYNDVYWCVMDSFWWDIVWQINLVGIMPITQGIHIPFNRNHYNFVIGFYCLFQLGDAVNFTRLECIAVK